MRSRRSNCDDLGPNIFLGNRAVAPPGNRYHAATTLEFPDDARPFPGPERDRVASELRRSAAR